MNTELKIWEFQKNHSNKKINYNNKEYTCILKDKELYLDKNIIVLGDTVNINNTNYLATGQEWSNIYDKFIIEKAVHTIKIYINNKLNNINCIVAVKDNQKIIYQQQIDILDGNIILTIKDTETNRKILEKTRILMMGNAWEVIAFTREKEGLINLYLKKTDFSREDDEELEIADYWEHNKKHDYKLTVDPALIVLKVGENIEIKPTLIDVNEEVTNAVYKIENATDITSVQKFTVVALKEGQGTIKVVALIDNKEVATCNLNVVITPIPPIDPPKTTHKIDGKETITAVYTSMFTVVDDKDIKATDSWTFTVDKDIVEMKTIDNATVELKVKSSGDIVLSATNGTETINKNIKCKMRR